MTAVLLNEAQHERLAELLVSFKLPTVGRELVQRLVAAAHEEALTVVLEVLELEAGDRHERRVERLLRASNLPPGKTLETLRDDRFPKPLMAKVRELATGEFLDRGGNALCFGLPGVGKSHVAAGIGHALVRRGRSVYYAPTYQVVQDLLAAKRDLALPRALRRFDAFDLVILDDLGYVQQSVDEAEVLFTLLAERYERRSVMVTSNLVFSEWGRIFKNPMTTAAAVDRLVHHATILEFAPMRTFRAPEPAPPATPAAPAADVATAPASEHQSAAGDTPATTTDDNYPAEALGTSAKSRRSTKPVTGIRPAAVVVSDQKLACAAAGLAPRHQAHRSYLRPTKSIRPTL